MLTAEVKVNGCLIGHIYAHNVGYTGHEDEWDYEYHVYDVNKAEVLKSGKVTHDRRWGAFSLVATIIDELPFLPQA